MLIRGTKFTMEMSSCLKGVSEYLFTAKKRLSLGTNSVISVGSNRSKKVLTLDFVVSFKVKRSETAFLKEKQALKMAAEQ